MYEKINMLNTREETPISKAIVNLSIYIYVQNQILLYRIQWRKFLMLTRNYFANMKRTKTLRNFRNLVFEHING